tara:strand:+ start:984 stop:1535 length:552 start_codon:yes stop_codon:yes gene_type:complete
MSSHVQQATFGGGCFWCTEAIYQKIIGIKKVISGYSGGHIIDPTYEAVCNGNTGHAEVIQIEFDSVKINYRSLLEIFWDTHDPTTPNQQGADIGTQYRSVIFYHNQSQEIEAVNLKKEVENSNQYNDPIVTEIVQLETFFPAESFHQEYYTNHTDQPYCKMVIDPKINKFRSKYSNMIQTDDI